MGEIEVSVEERWGLGAYPVASVFDKSVSAGDTLVVGKRDYPDLVMYVKVSGACDVVLEAVSGTRRKSDGSYAKISVSETIMSFSAAGEQVIRLGNVLTKKWALHYPFLHLKFTADTTIDLVALPITTTLQEAKIVGDEVGLATEATLSGVKAQTDKLQFDASNFLRAAIASDEVGLAKEATVSDIKSQLDVALSTRAPKDEGETITIASAEDISAGKTAALKNFKRWTLFLKTADAIDITVELSPDGSTYFTIPESPIKFASADDDVIEMGYNAKTIKLTGSNTSAVTAIIRGIY